MYSFICKLLVTTWMADGVVVGKVPFNSVQPNFGLAGYLSLGLQLVSICGPHSCVLYSWTYLMLNPLLPAELVIIVNN